MRRLAFVCCLLVASGCGAGKTDVRTRSGDTSFIGSIAYFALVSPPVGPLTAPNVFVLEIHDSPDGCAPHPGVSPYAGAVLYAQAVAPEGASLESGRFEITQLSGSPASAYYTRYPVSLFAVSGALELDQFSSTEARGTIDVTLSDDTRLQGEFLAAPCPQR